MPKLYEVQIIIILFWTFEFAKLNWAPICAPWGWWGRGPGGEREQLQITSDQGRPTRLILTVAAAAALPGCTVLLSVLTNSTSGVSQPHFSSLPFLHLSLLLPFSTGSSLSEGELRN